MDRYECVYGEEKEFAFDACENVQKAFDDKGCHRSDHNREKIG